MCYKRNVPPARRVALLALCIIAVSLWSGVSGAAEPARTVWLRPDQADRRARWGVADHLCWGLPQRRGLPDGPRGLLRLRYPTLPGPRLDLINFIAIEPIVRGAKGYSELERSRLDGVDGKRLWAFTPGRDDPRAGASRDSASAIDAPPPGVLARSPSGTETLSVGVGVERFDNGAEVALTVTQSSDAPDEITLVVEALPASAPIDYCILTATMGNKARARRLWLRDAVVTSHALYGDYRGAGFAPHRYFGLDRLLRTAAGDVLAAVTNDERDPAAADPSPAPRGWRYAGFPVTQYWKKPAGQWRDDLHVAVNARYTYWMSQHPIPGGVAFENFELRERFYPGQRFVFGITRLAPPQLGFPPLSDRPAGKQAAPAGAKKSS